MPILDNTSLLKATFIKGKDASTGKFIIDPLLPGYGMTVGHALRRVLLSSLGGAAITSVKIAGVTHEFSTITGVKEDVVEIILNLKSLRLSLLNDEPAILKLEKKGPGVVSAKDFQKNSSVKIIDENHHIATLDKSGKLSFEAVVKKGMGYEPVERRTEEKMELGSISVDSVFTPIKRIHYNVENTRVGGMTNYDKLTLEITTDGTVTPQEAFEKANQILIDHFSFILEQIQLPAKKNKAQAKLTEIEKKPAKKETVAKAAKKTVTKAKEKAPKKATAKKAKK